MNSGDTDLDEAQFAELREDLGDAFVGFVDGFLQSCQELPAELDADLERGALADAGARAHRLKGTAGYLGAAKLAARLDQLQRSAEAGVRDEVATQAKAAAAAIDALLPRLTRHLARG